ncbi:hypothetical protein PROFUN_03841 [Planoprotostelium fungivorum]|uniref:Ras guanine nucleotide exchange factor n=1 Tax=Planoprotostelium fungivorum TaxID=1890364 RepID=A0A2P6NI97_9EUKA|nr:hypothetical protein PROFUN_03841 [Planoprotostelium fungivorum]
MAELQAGFPDIMRAAASNRTRSNTIGARSPPPPPVVDRSDWAARVGTKHKEIAALKERIYPLERACSFAQEYYTDEGSIKAEKRSELLKEDVIMQLIMQHLEMEGLRQSRKELEKVSGRRYVQRPELTDSRLVTLMRLAVKDTEMVWDHTMDDKFTTEETNANDLREHLLSLDLHEDKTQSEDTNIWNESQFNFVPEEKDPNSLKAASLNHIILRMTDEETKSNLRDIVLYTYQTFVTPEKLLQKLIERYQVPAKDPTLSKRDEEWRVQKARIRIQVIQVIKSWITRHFDDFKNSDKLMTALEEFIKMVEIESKNLAQQLTRALDLHTGVKTIEDSSRKDKIPEPKIPWKTIFSPALTIWDCDDEEIARQLSIIEFNIFSSIQASELMNQAWTKPRLRHKAPNIIKMTERSNLISNWVAFTILSQEKIRKRVKAVTRFIRIAEFTAGMNNFSTAMAIVSGGLGCTAVHKLKYTWAELPNQQSRTFQELSEKLTDPLAYRNMLNAADQPCIPFLGLFLRDLVYIDENPDTIDDLINVNKRKQIYDIIEKVTRYQNQGYSFVEIPQIAQMLDSKRMYIVTEEEMNRMSDRCEPRNADRNSIQ